MSTFASKRGRSKRKSEQESHSLLNYFGPSSSEIPPSKFVRQIVNDIVDLSVNEVEKKKKKTRLGISLGQNGTIMESEIPVVSGNA